MRRHDVPEPKIQTVNVIEIGSRRNVASPGVLEMGSDRGGQSMRLFSIGHSCNTGAVLIRCLRTIPLWVELMRCA